MSATTTPRERPILFSGPMVRALLEGRKSQTRRVVKAPKHQSMHGRTTGWDAAFVDTATDTGEAYLKLSYGGGDLSPNECTDRVFCPYGTVGDLLWVRETWGELRIGTLEQEGVLHYQTVYRADKDDDGDYREWLLGGGWRPSIHMPRWASRLTLRITGIRVERVQDISEADAMAEGLWQCDSGFWWYDPTRQSYLHRDQARPGGFGGGAVDAYRELWDSINGAKPGHSWESNPWVWVVEFERVAQEESPDA